jgi:hypothetical protein
MLGDRSLDESSKKATALKSENRDLETLAKKRQKPRYTFPRDRDVSWQATQRVNPTVDSGSPSRLPTRITTRSEWLGPTEGFRHLCAGCRERSPPSYFNLHASLSSPRTGAAPLPFLTDCFNGHPRHRLPADLVLLERHIVCGVLCIRTEADQLGLTWSYDGHTLHADDIIVAFRELHVY